MPEEIIEIPFPREALAAAASRMEQASGNRLQLDAVDEVLKYKLNRVEAEEIVTALTRSVESGTMDADYRSSAYWALGKKSDDELLDFFRVRLRAELDADEMGACYQLMIALDNLDEEIFAPGRNGGSINEYDLNRHDAEAYLTGIQ